MLDKAVRKLIRLDAKEGVSPTARMTFRLLDDIDELRRLIRRKDDACEHGAHCECATCLKVDSDIWDVVND